jgi:hypothetical protein
MALFLDGPISSLEDLRAYETSLLDTATIEGVSLANKLQIAQQELGNEVLRFLIQQLEPAESVTPEKMSQVVVTDPLRRWHILRTLAVFFRDVHHNQLNDRYKAKWNAYEVEAKAAARMLWEVGVGLVRNPLRRPGSPILLTEETEDEYPQLLFKTTWVAGPLEESAPSDAVLFAPVISERARLTVSDPPLRATGWHVYAGPSEALLTRQTAAPLSLSDTWVLPEGAPLDGPSVPFGQMPDQFVRLQRLLFRG